MQRQPELLEVVGALRPASRLAGRLNGRQQQGDQDGDDGDHHQQLDQGEAATFPHDQCPLITKNYGTKTK